MTFKEFKEYNYGVYLNALVELQQDFLDNLDIESSIFFGDNDIAENIEIYLNDCTLTITNSGEEKKENE